MWKIFVAPLMREFHSEISTSAYAFSAKAEMRYPTTICLWQITPIGTALIEIELLRWLQQLRHCRRHEVKRGNEPTFFFPVTQVLCKQGCG